MILSLLLYFKFTMNIDPLQYSWRGAMADVRSEEWETEVVFPNYFTNIAWVVPVQIKMAVWHTGTSHWANVDFETDEGFFLVMI